MKKWGIKEILEEFPAILDLFIIGYFALYVVYGNTFIDYDIVTRIILSICSSLMLVSVPFSGFGIIVIVTKQSKKRVDRIKIVQALVGVFVIFIF